MGYITKQQLSEIIKNAPEGTDAGQMTKALILKGHTLEGFKSKQELTTFAPTTQNIKQDSGFLGRLVQGIARPVLKTASTVASAGRGIAKIGEAGVRRAVGDVEGAKKAFIEAGQPVEFSAGFLGEATPIESTLEAIGIGAELGSYLIGGSGVRNIFSLKGQVWQGIKTGLKYGAADGFLGSSGLVLQKDKEDIISGASLLEIGAGTTLGAGIGGVVGGAVPVAKNVWSFLRKGGRQFTEEVIEETAGRAGKTTKQITTREVPLKKQHLEVKTAVKSGIPAPEANLMKNASSADKLKFRKMFDLAERGEKSLKITRRPVAEAGDTILARVKHLQKVRQQAGKSLGELVDSMPDRPTDVSEIFAEYVDNIQRAGVRIKENKLNFRQSRWAGSKSGTIRSNVAQLYDDLRPRKKGLTPKRIHTIRQRVFDDLQLGKKQQVLSGHAESLMKKTRQRLNEPLDEISSQYRKLNKQFAITTGSINDFYNLIGQKWSGQADDILSLRAGEVGQRILGNASAKPLGILEQLERNAVQSGFKAKDSILDQMLFVDFLEDLFGTTQTRSLRGQVSRAGVDAAEAVADLVTGKPAKLATKLWLRARNITPEAQKQAVKKLIGF